LLDTLSTDGEVVEEEDEPLEDEESVEELKERLHKRNRSIKIIKKSSAALGLENDALRKQLDELSSKVEQIGNSERSIKEVETREQRAQKWKDRLEEDPTSVAELLQEQMEEQQTIMQNTMEKFYNHFSTLINEVNPETFQHRDEIQKARDLLGGLEGVPDDQVMKIAKILSEKKVPVPRGTTGGNRIRTSAKKALKISDELKAQLGFGDD
jgi:predicted RNase H-like nuclease (RuvC/YqgF family)